MNRATYSPEDNKLRLYVGRVPRDEYEELRAEGWTSTPKQDCDFAATWTPAREDRALSYLDDGQDIEDEDYSPQERAADRAERFEGYREKRTAEAIGHADTFDSSPAFGHQNHARAERQARRHDRHRARAVSQWSKAEYWQQRTAGVISHALYRTGAHCRRGRILTIEKEIRDIEARQQKANHRRELWERVRDTAADSIATMGGRYSIDREKTPESMRLAYDLANANHGGQYKHPTTGETASLYDLIIRDENPITDRQAAELWLSADDASGYRKRLQRWLDHLKNRLAYENAQLDADGGTVTTKDIEPGGWIRPPRRAVQFGNAHVNGDGWAQVLSVARSPVTGRVTSVRVLGDDRYLNDRAVKPRLIKVDRLGADAYREPTADELADFQAKQKAEKAEKRAKTPKAPPLINPTDEDAQALQDRLNDEHRAALDRFSTFEPKPVLRMTQKQYSELSRGTYSKAETTTLHSCGKLGLPSSNLWTSSRQKYRDSLGAAVCKIRVYGYQPRRVVILTDKPQKRLPKTETPAAQNAATE